MQEEEEDNEKEEGDKEEEVEEDSKYHKPPALTPADGALSGSQSHDKPEANSAPFENKVTISTFGSIMRITSSSTLNSGGSSKIRKISSGDYKLSKALNKSSQLSTPPILEEAEREDKATPPTLPRERRHRGSKKSSHGPGRPRGSKNRERREEEHHHHHATPFPPPPPPPPTLTSSLYPSSIPHPTFSSTLPLTTMSPFSSSSSSSFSSSTSSFSTSRGNSLLNSGE